ncbi:MAG TPA: hypothetical protein VHO24_13180 [Opitutaceae bacterium]|nr:hypothetical protein [Opitutaceae bacterium]
MAPTGEVFCEIVQEILQRFGAQNDLVLPPVPALGELAGRLWSVIEERGLPTPLAPGDDGRPGDLPDAECAPLLARVLGDLAEPHREKLAVPVRQLVKACFHPEFKNCRDSFREVSPDGACRRQQLARVRTRVSGTHCIDCPHWVTLAPAQHLKFLEGEWQPAVRSQLEANLGIFLPEDFRKLRHLLYACARRSI